MTDAAKPNDEKEAGHHCHENKTNISQDDSRS